jgi:ubiquinone/menaquinone biosynthesis C-methylase UbiE
MKADKKGPRNVQTILTDCNTYLPDSSVDVVLLFYVLHDFKNPDLIIEELNRVLNLWVFYQSCVDDQTPPFSFVTVYGTAKIQHYKQNQLLRWATKIAQRYMEKR